jgi:RNA polymerase sigma-70 factor (ECF subfamily)
MDADAGIFETHRPALLALAYRMLGDMARAEDMVQEAWLRWQNAAVAAESPGAFLLTTVTRLCLDELGSARARQEESRSDRLPEPVDLSESGLGRVETIEQISMAFLVLLQRLTPSERAALLLHDVFDMSHGEIAGLLGRSEDASRQLLRRAKENVATERRTFQTSREEHQRLLRAFVAAATSGDLDALHGLLAEDAVLIADAGPAGASYGRLRNVGHPVVGRKKIASLVKAFAAEDVQPPPEYRERELNGQPAIVDYRHGHPTVALLIAVAEGRIRNIYLHVDPERLRHVDPASPTPPGERGSAAFSRGESVRSGGSRDKS